MSFTVSLLLFACAALLGLVPFRGLAGRPMYQRVAVALSVPAVAALELFFPWDASPTWQLVNASLDVSAAILVAVLLYVGMRAQPALVPLFLVPGILGVGVTLLTVRGSALSKAFWVGHGAPGRQLVYFSGLAVGALASWLWRKRERHAGR